MASAPATLPVLHRLLGFGLTGAATVFLLLRYRGVPAVLDDDSVRVVFAAAFAGVAFVLSMVALLFLKPRVPDRPAGQSVERSWTRPDVAARVSPVWFALEAAGMLAGVGYLITGETVAAIATGLTIGAFWRCGPNVFAKP